MEAISRSKYGVIVHVLVCLALVNILAWHATVALIAAAIRVVGHGTVIVMVTVPILAAIVYLIG